MTRPGVARERIASDPEAQCDSARAGGRSHRLSARAAPLRRRAVTIARVNRAGLLPSYLPCCRMRMALPKGSRTPMSTP